MMEKLSIAALARVLYPQTAGQRVMALLEAYFDASFTSAGEQRVTCIGGYIGTEEQWLGVEAKWNAMLARWGLDEFHLSPLLAGWLPPVSRSDGEACALSFAKIITQSKLTGIVAALREDDWLTLEKSSEYATRFPTAYHACLHMLFEVLEEHVKLEFPNDPFSLVVDLDKTDRETAAATEAICAELRTNPRCASIVFGRRSQFPLIQCADLCAGLSRKEWLENGFIPKKAPRTKLGWATHSVRSRGTFWSLETAKYFAEVMEQQAKRRAENAAKASLS